MTIQFPSLLVQRSPMILQGPSQQVPGRVGMPQLGKVGRSTATLGALTGSSAGESLGALGGRRSSSSSALSRSSSKSSNGEAGPAMSFLKASLSRPESRSSLSRPSSQGSLSRPSSQGSLSRLESRSSLSDISPQSSLSRPPSQGSLTKVEQEIWKSIRQSQKDIRKQCPGHEKPPAREGWLMRPQQAEPELEEGNVTSNSVNTVFLVFCTRGRHDMSADQFVKLCELSHLIDDNFTAQDALRICEKDVHCEQGRLDLQHFKYALSYVASKKRQRVQTVYKAVERTFQHVGRVTP